MDSSLTPEQLKRANAPEIPSILSLLEQGLDYIQQGRDTEGAAMLALARTWLSPDQGSFANELDTFIAAYAEYLHARQDLQEASIHFAKVHAQQKALVTTLVTRLPTLMEETETQQYPTYPHINTTGHQPWQSQHERRENDQAFLSSPASQLLTEDTSMLPALYITCFGSFAVRRLDEIIELCHNRSGQTILRYLMAQTGYRANMDVLMEVLWPDDEPDVARRKLQIAVYALRRSLNSHYSCGPGGGYILFKDRVYQLNPAVSFRSDVDDFLALYKAGQQAAHREEAATYFERACRLHTGPFLAEDLYADWPINRREQLSQVYLAMCSTLADHYLQVGRFEDAAKWASTILNENRCDEAAHRLLIRIYTVQGRRSEALRQYQRCERVLLEDLGVRPMPETVHVFQSILNYEHTQPDEAKIK